jgi:hypothetical protein
MIERLVGPQLLSSVYDRALLGASTCITTDALTCAALRDGRAIKRSHYVSQMLERRPPAGARAADLE